MDTLNDVIVWSQPNCHYCHMAIQRLEECGYDVEVRVIGTRHTKEEFVTRFPGVRTVPVIENGDSWFSYAELKEFLNAKV